MVDYLLCKDLLFLQKSASRGVKYAAKIEKIIIKNKKSDAYQ